MIDFSPKTGNRTAWAGWMGEAVCGGASSRQMRVPRVSGRLEDSPALVIRIRIEQPITGPFSWRDVREPETAMRCSASTPRGVPTIAFLVVMILSLVDPAKFLGQARAASFPQHNGKLRSAPTPESKEQPVPFREAETLTYRISWSVFSSAASLELRVIEHRDLFGAATWHFRGVAHTLNSVRTLFPIDDQFDSYTDAATLDGRQFETHLNEMGKSTNQLVRLSPSGKPATLPPPIVVVPAGTRDPLGFVYALRGVDWRRTSESRTPVYDGHDLYEMRAIRESADESVKVAAGTYSAWHISIHVFQGQKEISAVRYAMWVASNAARTPVLMEADLPFGTIRAELASQSQ